MPKKVITGFTWSLILLVGLGVWLRLVRLRELFHFTYDEEIIAFVGKRMWINGHIPLIGGVTPQHVHLAPYFYWFSGLILGLGRLSPLIWGVAAAMLAGMGMLVLYQTGRSLFNKRVGLVAVIFYAFSFYQNIFDRHYWGLIFAGLVSLSCLYSLQQILRGRILFAWVLGLALAFGLHTDPSTLIVLIFAITIFLIYIKKPQLFGLSESDKHLQIGKSIKIIIGILLISLLPLVVFDLKHNFSNIRGFGQYIQELKMGKQGVIRTTPLSSVLFLPQTLARTMYVFGDQDLAKQYAYCPQYAQGRLEAVPSAVIFGVLALFIYLIYEYQTKSKDKSSLGLVLALFFATYVGIILYGVAARGDLFDHYLAALFPIFYISLAYLVVQLSRKSKWISVSIVTVFIVFNLPKVGSMYHTYGYQDKESAVKWAIAQTGSADFALDVIGSCFRFNGYRYLFYLYGKEPVKSYVDANFTHLYDQPPAQTHPKLLVVLTNPDFVETRAYLEEYEIYRQKLIRSQKFGKIEVMLIDNSDLTFVGKF